MEAGGRLVEDVQRAAGGDLGELGRQLHSLRLAAGERRRCLAEADVVEADVVQGAQATGDLRHVLEEDDGLLDRHLEHVADVLALEADLERLAVVALAVALLAGHVDVGQEVHLDLDLAVAAADLAAAALDVEAEAARFVAARPRLLGLGEELADVVEDAGVGGRVGARRAPDRRLVDVDDLVDLAEPVDAVVGARTQLRLVQAVGDRVVQGLVDQGRLARAGDAGDAAEDAERHGDVDALEVVFAGAANQQRAVRAAPLLRQLDLALAGEVLAGQRGRVLGHFGRRAGGDHVATVLAGAGPEVDEVIGGHHRALVVLDHDHRVAEVAQPVEGGDQLLVVALVQADRGLVEHVHHADQAGADLGREADPLRLAAGERAGRAAQREVADADVLEEGEPFGDLAHDQARDRPLGLGHLQGADPLRGAARRLVAELGDADPADLDREALRPQARAFAVRAGLLGHVALDPLAVGLRVGLFVAALEVVDDPLEADFVGAAAAEAVGVADLVALRAGAVEEDLFVEFLQLRPGLVEVDLISLGDRGDQPLPVGGDAAIPGLQGALAERERRVGHDQLGIDHPLEAEPVTALAGAVRRVEGEDPRLQLGDRGAAIEAGELLGEEQRLGLAVDHLDFDQAGGKARGGLDRLGEAPAQVRLHHQAVDDHGDVVFEFLVEDDLLVEPAQLAVDFDPRVALEAELLEQLSVLAFAPPHHRRHHHEFGALLERHQPVDDLLLGLAGDLGPALGAVRDADPGPEQAQVVVDLGHRADGRARIARGRLLVDRDRRREPLDRVDVGLLHQAEELARVGGERLDVAALSLGVDRVEGKARLARAGKPGDHDQRVARQLNVNVLEVVLPRSRDDDSLRSGH